MTFAHRRYAREAALMALCLAEASKISAKAALEQALEMFDDAEVREEVLPDGMADALQGGFRDFAALLTNGVWERKAALDRVLDDAMPNYAIERLAAVDRNVLRLGTWELYELPYVPPLVTINEAIEIAKKYATAESGRFVNGVLAAMLRDSPKASYDPRTAPRDPVFERPEEAYREPERAVVEETVEAGSDEAKRAKRYGLSWTLRSDGEEPEKGESRPEGSPADEA